MGTYNWDSKDYETHSSGQQQWARELIAKLSLDGTEELLDIGCGDGKVTAELASLLPAGRVIGIDSSKSMIDLARKRYPPEDYKNLVFEMMDAADLIFGPQFDQVFSNAALHWVKDHRPVVASIYRCLRPGGRVLLQMGGQGNAKDILRVLEKLVEQPQHRHYFKGFEFPCLHNTSRGFLKPGIGTWSAG